MENEVIPHQSRRACRPSAFLVITLQVSSLPENGSGARINACRSIGAVVDVNPALLNGAGRGRISVRGGD